MHVLDEDRVKSGGCQQTGLGGGLIDDAIHWQRCKRRAGQRADMHHANDDLRRPEQFFNLWSFAHASPYAHMRSPAYVLRSK